MSLLLNVLGGGQRILRSAIGFLLLCAGVLVAYLILFTTYKVVIKLIDYIDKAI